ncbi:MAG: hypothetical protein CME06_07645 [Gemmatimonadetes bacterium]|nr:hypothetical protein [Gemmatimonadota bacterium]
MQALPALRLAVWVYAGYLLSWVVPPALFLPWVARLLVIGLALGERVLRRRPTRLAPVAAALVAGLAQSPAPAAGPLPPGASRERDACIWVTAGEEGVDAHTGERFRLVARAAVELPSVGELSRIVGELRPAGRIRHFRPGLVQVGAAGRVASRERPALLIARSLLEPCAEAHPIPIGLRLRSRLSRAIAASSDETGLFRALLLADRSSLDPTLVDSMRAAGLAHLLALSGLHIGFVATVTAACLSRFPRRWGAIALLFVVTLLPLIVGGAPSVLRACIAVGAWAFAAAVGRRTTPLNAVGIGALAILILDAEAPTAAGFQLSFAATSAILICGARSGRGLAGWGAAALRVGLAAQFATMGLVAHHFGRVPIWSPLSGLIGIPLTGTLLASLLCGLPSALGGHGLGRGVEGVAAWCAAGLAWTARFFAELPLSSFEAPGLSLPAAIGLAGAGLALIRALVRRSSLSLGAALLLTALGLTGVTFRALADPPFSVLVGDVGQGLAVWIGLPDGRSLLYDAGPPGYRGPPPVMRAIDRAVGSARQEILITSHAHADHDGGVPWATEARRPMALLYPTGRHESLRASSAAQRQGIPAIGLEPSDEVEMDAWWARRPLAGDRTSVNDGSIALGVRARGVAIMLPGDLEAAGERALAEAGPIPHADILVLGHHGSRTSSRKPFLDAVSPSLAIASAGFGNRFGHPHPETITELEARGIPLLRTDRDGAVLFETDGRRWWCRTAAGRRWSGKAE